MLAHIVIHAPVQGSEQDAFTTVLSSANATVPVLLRDLIALLSCWLSSRVCSSASTVSWMDVLVSSAVAVSTVV